MDSDRHRFEGRFSDGGSAASTTVLGEMRTDGIVFWPADTPLVSGDIPAEHWNWTYDALTTNESVRAGDPDVLIHYTDDPGSTLFVADTTFIARLSDEADHTSQTAWFWRFTKPALAIVAVLAAIGGAVYVFDLSPARALAKMMPQSTRVQIGNSLFTSLTKDKYKVCSTPGGDAALAKMAARLKRTSDAPFTTRVIDWKLENAFALPGNQVVLTRGLIEGAASAEEVTGVLAHEIGHVVKLHPETGIVRGLGLMVAAQFIFTGGAETAGNLGTLLVALRFNRGAEREADTVGLRILEEAGVDPRPMAGFFERMLKKRGFSADAELKRKDDETDAAYKRRKTLQRGVSTSLDLLSTHPPSKNRIKKINAAATYKARPVLTADEWSALRSICKTD